MSKSKEPKNSGAAERGRHLGLSSASLTAIQAIREEGGGGLSERALAAALHAVVELAPWPLVVVNHIGQIVDANHGFAEACGVGSCSAIAGRKVADFTAALDGSPSRIELSPGASFDLLLGGGAGAARPYRVQVLYCGGSSDSTLPAGDDQTTDMRSAAYLLNFEPLVTGLSPEEEQRALQQKKLESLGVLAGSVAHDLNNILTGVLGHVSYLRLSLPPGEASRESISAIEDGARRAAAMTQQILEFARGEKVELCPVNLSLVVAAAANLVRASMPREVALRVRSEREDVYVTGDESQLSQLVMNLLVNAKDALGGGGEIEVRLTKVNLDRPRGSGEMSVGPGEYVNLMVADNGAGMSPEIQKKIFEPFFTTKSKRGTGIGLATVLSIVKAHRGAIFVQSKLGVGTCFETLVPIAQLEDLPAVEAPARVVDALPTGNEKILVVDDEEAVRTVMQRSLEHLGYNVLVARNGVDALESYHRERGSIRLVILDMIMPNMPGDELFYKLQEIDDSVAVLIASGYSSDGRTRAVLEDGALGFIQKPFAVEDLAQEVRRCLDFCPRS